MTTTNELLEIIEYNGYTITNKSDSQNSLIFKGVDLPKVEINKLPLKCISGDVFENDGVFSNNSIEKAKRFIDSL